MHSWLGAPACLPCPVAQGPRMSYNQVVPAEAVAAPKRERKRKSIVAERSDQRTAVVSQGVRAVALTTLLSDGDQWGASLKQVMICFF